MCFTTRESGLADGGHGHGEDCQPWTDPGFFSGIVTAIGVHAMYFPSLNIPSWVLVAGAFLLTLGALFRISLWFLAKVVRDTREQMEGE